MNQRGLPRAIGPDERMDFAGHDRERDFVTRNQRAISLCQLMRL
jgi:hypothetical protein